MPPATPSQPSTRRTRVVVLVLCALLIVTIWLRLRARPTTPQQPAPAAAEPAATSDVPRARALRSTNPPPLADPQDAAPPAAPVLFGTFAGRVVSAADGRGIPGAVLTFERAGATSSALTDSSGAFQFVPSHAGSYSLVWITAEGFVPFAPVAGQSPIAFVAAPGVAVRDVVLTLAAQIEIVVRVVDAAGAPAPDALVSRLDAAESSEGARTDATGEARIAVRPGSLIDARRPPAAPARGRVDDAALREHRMTLHLGADVVGAYPGLQSITGRTVDARGEPVENAQIVARPMDGDAAQPFEGLLLARGRAVSGPDGRFELRDVDAGQYMVSASAAGFAPARLAVSTRDAHDVVLELRPGARLAGTVREAASNRGVQGFTMVVLSRGAGARTESFFDAEGRYEIDGLAPGPHLVRVLANGYAPARDTPVQLPDSGEPTTQDFALTLGGRLRGRVIDARTRAPVAGAHVELDGRPSAGDSPVQSALQARTDAGGNFELAGIPQGPQSIEVRAEGYNERLVSGLRAASEGAPEPITVDVTPAQSSGEARREVVGIGVSVSVHGGRLLVASVMPESGAAEAGIAVGDQLVSVDGTALTDTDLSTAVQLIRGEEGTWVRIAFVRAADGSPQERLVPRRRVSFPR